MAFFSTPEVLWLYSGVTKTNPSNEEILSAHALVCSFWYWPIEGGSGSARGGRGESRRAVSSYTASLRPGGRREGHPGTPPPLRCRGAGSPAERPPGTRRAP